MTREENLDWLYRLKSEIYVYMPKEWLIPMNNALDMAIKALEQESCEDAISLEAVIEWLKSKDIIKLSSQADMARKELKALPSVTPQPKIGRWKRISIDKYVQHAMAYYKCSVCDNDIIGTHNYCPSCGAKMQEVEEE